MLLIEKLKLTCIFIWLRTFVIVFSFLGAKANIALKTDVKKLPQDSVKVRATCDATATISGSNCLGSTLKLRSNVQLSSIKWVLNGATTVSTQTISPSNVGIIVAGGKGAGPALNQLSAPDRFYIDPAGNIYIPELGNNRVTKWAPGATSGVVVAGGNGTGSAANQLNRPTSVWVDSNGNVLIADQNNNRIQKWAPGATSGTTVITYVNDPTGICVDKQNNIYVSEQFAGDVRKFAPGSNIGAIVARNMYSPTGIFIDPTGNLYVCDTDNSVVLKWAPGSLTPVTVAGGHGSGNNPDQLYNPLYACVDASGNVYVSDYNNNRIQKWAPGAISGTTVANNLGNPVGLWIDASYNLFVSEFSGNNIREFLYIVDTFTPTVPGDYTAEIVSVGNCTATSNTITISDNKTPQITISSDTKATCTSFQPKFTAQAFNGGDNPLYQWQINGVNNGPNSTSSSFTSANLKPGDAVTCVLTSNYSCLTNPNATSNSIQLVAPTEKPNVVISTPKLSICEGSEAVFTATTLYGGTAPVYQWFINNQPAGTATTSDTFTAMGLKNDDQINCIVTSNANTCQLTSTAASNKLSIKVNPILTPTASITADHTPVYAGSMTTFNCFATSAGTTPVYDWQINGLSTGINTATFKNTVSLTSGDKITCVVTSTADCTSETQVQSNEIIVLPAIQNIQPPNTFTPNDDGINDTWKLDGITAFPNCKVFIYTRTGQLVFSSAGYAQEWDGKFNGIRLSVGTYYYVIKLNAARTLSGAINLIK